MRMWCGGEVYEELQDRYKSVPEAYKQVENVGSDGCNCASRSVLRRLKPFRLLGYLAVNGALTSTCFRRLEEM